MTARILGSCIVILAIAAPGQPQAGRTRCQREPALTIPLTVGTRWTYQVGDHQSFGDGRPQRGVEIKVQKPDADKKLKEEMIKVHAFQLEAKSDDRVQSETVAVLEAGVLRLAPRQGDRAAALFLKLPVNKAGEPGRSSP